MFKFLPLITLFTVFISASFLSYAQVYKWQDSEGKWRYSDIKPMKVKNVKLLHGKKTKPKFVAAEGGANKKSDPQSATQKEAKAKPEQLLVEKEDLAMKKQNCNGAKANLIVYSNGGRIRRANEEGKMEFLSDASIAKMKIKAQQDVKEYCG